MSTKIAVVAALLAPLATCVAVVPVRDDLAGANAALVLVLIVVGVASTGHRGAGLMSALSAGLWFDFFLTPPYQSVAIRSGDDIATALLLLGVGIGVTELAAWGRRQQAAASRDQGYLAGITAASQAVARGSTSPSELIDQVSRQLTAVLGVRRTRFDYRTGLDAPRLHADGTVTWRRATWTTEVGLPDTDQEIELLAESGGAFRGRFLFTASPGLRLTKTQALVASSLAGDVASSLAEFDRR